MGSFVELAMQRQRSFADEIWVDIAFDAGVADTAAFSTCIRSSRNDGRIERGKALAREIGAQGTPAIAVNGRLAGILPTLDELREIVGRPVASAPEI
jgi:protein-disulfide isomerase